MNINIIELIKENGFKISRNNVRELLILLSSIGELKKENNKLYFNNEQCNLLFLNNKIVIDINLSRKITISIDKSKIELTIQELKKSQRNIVSITSIPNNYFRYVIERKTSNNEIIEYKGLEVKREYDVGTNIKYFKKIGESYIKKTDNCQEDELPVSLIGISKVNEIDEKLLCNKKLVLYKD